MMETNAMATIASDAVKYLAVATWLTVHRVLLNRGFILSRSILCTDTICCIAIGATAILWSAVVLILEDNSNLPSSNLLNVLDKISQTPLIVLTLFMFWLLTWLDGIQALKIDYARFYLWKLSAVAGPFDWDSSLNSSVYRALCITLWLLVVPTAVAAAASGAVIRGVLTFISLVVFLSSGTGQNPYVNAQHRYTGDMLRIALATSHHEGTAYILPSAEYGIDAVWTPKVQNEHLDADRIAMALFQSMRSGTWSLKQPNEAIRAIVSSYQEKAVLSPKQLIDLANWLYLIPGSTDSKMSSIRCERAPGVHLIGRDLMYALCHAEYLVFMGQGCLPLELRSRLGMLRLMKRSGGSKIGNEDVKTIGFEPGLEGYREAVRYIYLLFDQPLDTAAIDFSDTSPPTYSAALSKAPASIDEYVTELWDISRQHTESTFTALYMFTTIWFIEVGNVNGFHIFPLRCKNRNGDLIGLQILWRQAFYCGIIAQLIAASPWFFGAFVAGYLG